MGTDVELDEATRRVAEGIREDLEHTVQSAAEHALDNADAAEGMFEEAVSAGMVAAEAVFEEAVSMGFWVLRGQGSSDWCRVWGETEDVDRVIRRGSEHGLLLVYGAAYAAALAVCTRPKPDAVQRDTYVVVAGGVVQNTPSVPVFDFDVLVANDFDAAAVEEVQDLRERMIAHGAPALAEFIADCDAWLKVAQEVMS